MARAKDSTRQRAWFVFGPIALILIGAGWLAFGLAVGSARRRPQPIVRIVPDRRREINQPPLITRVYARPSPAARWLRNDATGSSYRAIRAQTWRKAQARAANMGGRLVTVDDA